MMGNTNVEDLPKPIRPRSELSVIIRDYLNSKLESNLPETQPETGPDDNPRLYKPDGPVV